MTGAWNSQASSLPHSGDGKGSEIAFGHERPVMQSVVLVQRSLQNNSTIAEGRVSGAGTHGAPVRLLLSHNLLEPGIS